MQSATELHQALQQGKQSIHQAIDQCLQRIQQFNPMINAVVTLNPQLCQQAQQAEQNPQAAKPALYGIPISIKDAFATKDLITTSSHPPLKDYLPPHDATLVQRLRTAGALLVGKTNLPELAGDPQCNSPLFGRTNNPWAITHTSGGSSGGSAAAVAMGFSYLDLGSDIGGSIRIPAAYCGVVGFKASEHRLPRTGHIPHLPQQKRNVRHLLSFGVLTRTVADVALSFKHLAGADGHDTEVPNLPIQPISHSAKTLRIAWWDDFAGLPLCKRTQLAMQNTVQKLQQAGYTVEKARPHLFDFPSIWQSYGLIAGAEIGLNMPLMQRHALKWLGHFLPKTQILSKSLTQGFAFNWRVYNQALQHRDVVMQSLEQFLDTYDVWLCPVALTTAYPHIAYRGGKPPIMLVDDQPLAYFEATLSCTTPFSLTGNPVITLPAGIYHGLPVGLQVVGKRWQDETLIANSLQLETILGGYQAPPYPFN